MYSVLGALVSTKLWLQPVLQPFSFRLNPWVPSLVQPLLLPSNSRQAVISSCLPATQTKWRGSPFSGSPPTANFSASHFFPVSYLTVLQWITLSSFLGSMTSPIEFLLNSSFSPTPLTVLWTLTPLTLPQSQPLACYHLLVEYFAWLSSCSGLITSGSGPLPFFLVFEAYLYIQTYMYIHIYCQDRSLCKLCMFKL